MSKKNRGFTFVELMVTIAIIGILAAILLPALARARVAAMRSAAIKNIATLAPDKNPPSKYILQHTTTLQASAYSDYSKPMILSENPKFEDRAKERYGRFELTKIHENVSDSGIYDALREIEENLTIDGKIMAYNKGYDAIRILPSNIEITGGNDLEKGGSRTSRKYHGKAEVEFYNLTTTKQKSEQTQTTTPSPLSPITQKGTPTLELKSELGFTLGLRISDEGLHFYGEKDKVKKHLEKFKAGMIALQAYTKSSGAFDFESMTDAQEGMLKVAGFKDIFPYRGGLLDPDTQSILFE